MLSPECIEYVYLAAAAVAAAVAAAAAAVDLSMAKDTVMDTVEAVGRIQLNTVVGIFESDPGMMVDLQIANYLID